MQNELNHRPKQHWLPAVILGQFSKDKERTRPRDRRISVQRRTETSPRLITAKNLAYERGLYDMDELLPGRLPVETLDATFNLYERHLPAALGSLREPRRRLLDVEAVALGPWLRTIVPYVAGLTVRNPSFLAAERKSSSLILFQTSRLIEMTRALAPLMCADWYAIRTTVEAPFIINDRGFTWTKDTGNGRGGVFVPLEPTLGLAIIPSPRRTFGVKSSDQWFTPMPTSSLLPGDVGRFNAAIASSAIDWFAGMGTAELNGLGFSESADLESPALGADWPNRGGLGAHDRDWSVAMHLAGMSVTGEDWQPVSIASSIEPAVRLDMLEGHQALIIDFV